MAKFKIEYSDFQRIIEISRNAMGDDFDILLQNEFENLVGKYSINQQVNEIKRQLFAKIKEYPIDTAENKKAYEAYQNFNVYIKRKESEIENGTLNYDELAEQIEQLTGLGKI